MSDKKTNKKVYMEKALGKQGFDWSKIQHSVDKPSLLSQPPKPSVTPKKK